MTNKHPLEPDWAPGLTIAHLPLPHLTARNIQAAVLDVDRTLLPGRNVELPESVRTWLDDAKRRMRLHLFSNNPSKPRIAAVADQLGLSFTSGAGKPRRGALRRVIQELDLPNDQIAMVGDRCSPTCCAVIVSVSHRVRQACAGGRRRLLQRPGATVGIGSGSGDGRPGHDPLGGQAGDKPAARRWDTEPPNR